MEIKNKLGSKKIVPLIGMFLMFTLLISIPAVTAQFSGGVQSSFGGNYQVIGISKWVIIGEYQQWLQN